jgi:hypothetical protein
MHHLWMLPSKCQFGIFLKPQGDKPIWNQHIILVFQIGLYLGFQIDLGPWFKDINGTCYLTLRTWNFKFKVDFGAKLWNFYVLG